MGVGVRPVQLLRRSPTRAVIYDERTGGVVAALATQTREVNCPDVGTTAVNNRHATTALELIHWYGFRFVLSIVLS